jgi:hypothetical protein
MYRPQTKVEKEVEILCNEFRGIQMGEMSKLG